MSIFSLFRKLPYTLKCSPRFLVQKTLHAHSVVKISYLPGSSKIITLWCCLFFLQTVNVCVSILENQSAQFDFLCVILKLMTPPLCNSRRADQQSCTEISPALGLVCALMYVYKNKQMHHFNPVFSHIRLCCFTALSLSFIRKSMDLNSLTVVLPRVMQQHLAVSAAPSYAAVFDLMKYVNRETAYVTQCRMSGLVIGLKTEPQWECDLTQTYATFVWSDVTCWKIHLLKKTCRN